ncbi:UvrD-helicase domain-containing protein [Larkinella terrae]|uniref:DNA 3'-5' helicase n=1 Tax=Larkinella terrae TaxID=2025311 RepID=A0A7K0EKZ9_9BACT|nr:UvrD-helicase domain-containing protein [Larkinella terrae]MRS62128.1 AAA family ATPase [Larkinella terrae]
MFKIFSSSAGSGKTYTLTKEYLKLALGDRSAGGKAFESHQFKNILAVTFTNAAARDMKDRILEQLQKITSGDLNSQLTELARELKIEPYELQSRARQTFHTILHDYSAFSVLTIDSFVQRVVTAFTDDLELPYSFEVEMDTDAVLQTAIDRLLEKVGQEDHPYLSEALEEFYLDNASDGKSWYGLAGTLAEFSKGQLGDRNYEYVQKLKELNPENFRTIRRNLRDKNREVEKQIEQVAREAYQLIQEAGLSDKAFYYGDKGVGTYFKKRMLLSGFPEEPNTYVRKAIDDDIWHSGKKNLTPEQLQIEALKEQLREYILQIEQIRADTLLRYRTFGAIEQHLQKVALLKQIKQECDDLLREQNRIHISEFNRLIVKVVTDEPVPFIYERLGEKFHHILIDEFQDTSKLQFVNLLPLIDNNLAYQRFNLAVGDAKQAIYRFRGGDMDQIVALHSGKLDPLLSAHETSEMTLERLSGLQPHLNPDRLATNWRSAESIVEFNNSFFRFMADFYADTEFEKVTEVFDEQFRQASAKAGVSGHVQIDFIEKPDRFATKNSDDDGPDFNTQMVEKTLALIQKAVADGYQYGDIAVLCRFKKNARRIADYLETNDIPLTSEDSLTLQSSERVRFLVSLLQLLHQPENRMVRYDMLFLYHRLINPNLPSAAWMEFMDKMAKAEDESDIFSLISKIDKMPLDPTVLQQLSIYELSEKLADYFDLFDNDRDSAYLFRFMDEVLTYSSRYSSHLSDFLNYWETAQEKVSVSTLTDQNAVTIQTIHKSKGLEYPVVIIPFADWSYKPRNNDTMWAELGPLGEIDELAIPGMERQEIRRLQTASITIKKDLDETPFADQYQDELYRTFVECMNLVYVAFTRPTDRLYIIAAKQDFSPTAKDGGFKNANGIDFWLYTYLTDLRGNPCWEEGKMSYALHDFVTQSSKHQLTTSEHFRVFVGNREGTQPLRLRRIERTIDTSAFEKSRAWWQKVCTALSLIQRPEDSDKAIRRMIAEGILRATEQETMQLALQKILTNPEIGLLFEPAKRGDNNRRILANASKTGKPQRNGPNRVVQFPDKVVLANYLTEKPDDPQLAKMRSFIKLFQQMGHVTVEGWLVCVSDCHIVKV